MTVSNLAEQETNPLEYRRWEPLPRILYGFAVAPFVPDSDSIDLSALPAESIDAALVATQQHLIALEVGDEVYVFEQLGHSGVSWYRGYVVSTTRVPTNATTTSSLSDYSTFPSTSAAGGASLVEEPQVYVGIFPRAHVHIRDQLDDAELRLADVYAKAVEDGVVGATAPPPTLLGTQHMETLAEEDEDGATQSPSKVEGEERASSSASQTQPTTSGKVSLNASRQSIIVQDSLTVDTDRPPPPLPSLRGGDETQSGMMEPLVDEIACALREWNALMYVYLGKRDYSLFYAVREHIEMLHSARRQLLARTLSEEEMSRLRMECVSRLVRGNVLQGLDVIVRHPGRGGLVDVEFVGKDSDKGSWISGIQLYALQAALAYIEHDATADGTGITSLPNNALEVMSKTIASSSKMHPSQSALSKFGTDTDAKNGAITIKNRDRTSLGDRQEQIPDIKYFHVFLDVRAFVASPCQPGETAELYFSLYNKAESRFLTEEFCIVLNNQGAPSSKERIGKMRALFTDLSSNDMHDLNIVCRIVRNGYMRLSSVDVGGTSESLTSTEDSTTEIPGFRIKRMTRERTVRRPFGCAVVELGPDHQIDIRSSASSPLREHVMPIFLPVNEAAFSTLHQDIIASRVREFEKSPRADLLAVGVKVLYGDKQQLIRENTALLQDAALTARLGFPDVVFPSDTRNEAYIKLWSGEFFPMGSKIPGGSSARNIQISAEVRLRDGSVLERAISRGAGEEQVTQFDSTVFYHQNAPTWGELLKIQLPSETMDQCHVFFTFRHRSSREDKPSTTATQTAQGGQASVTHNNAPFAHAYLPLFETNTAFIPDGSHTLLLWRTSRPAQQISPELYFTLPATVPAGKSLHELVPANLANIIQPLRDIMTLRTFLVSAKYTQNEVLLRLLNWESVMSEDAREIRDVLLQFAFVSEVEIVKFLRNIFDSLFGIVTSPKNGSGALDDLVFNALVTVVGIIQDRRFNNFKATLDVYIEQHFHSQTAHSRLMPSMARLLSDPAKADTSKNLRAAIKVWPYIFRFIVRSRENQNGLQDPIGALGGAVSDHFDSRFKSDLDALLRSVNRLMSTTKPNSIIGTQTLALQQFAGILPELARVYPMEELARIETAFTDSVYITKGKMTVWRLLHILHVIKDALFLHHESRSQMLPSIVRWVRPHLGRYDGGAQTQQGESQSNRDAAKISWIESARLSVAIVALVLDRLQVSLVEGRMGKIPAVVMRQEQDNVDYVLSLLPKLLETYIELDSLATQELLVRHHSASVAISSVPVIFPSTYPFPLIARSSGNLASSTSSRSYRRQKRRERPPYFNCGLGEIAAVLTVLIMLSPRRHLVGFLDEQLDVDGREKLSEFLFNFFEVGTSILLNEAYPSTWLNINILAHQVILKMADPLAALLMRDFIPSVDESSRFNTALWRAGFQMLLTLLSSEQLVIERFKPQRRRSVWRLAGDIRGEGAQIFAKLWNSIGWSEAGSEDVKAIVNLDKLNTGGFQVQFVPSLVEPVLELCLSHHDELRTCAVRVLATMITSEWHLNGSFGVIEAEIIDKLDVLFITDTQGDEVSRAFFIGQLRSLFDAPQVDDELRNQVHSCLLSVNRFLDLLLSVRSLPLEEGYEDDRVAGTLKLLGFLRQADRVTAFSTHVLRLVNLHLENQNYVEAALTLKLHADLHSWDMDKFVEPINDLDLPRQSHFARKETLYMLILDYLNKGQSWEISIDICRELAREYEFRAVDYSRLADVLNLQASLFQKIGTEERTYPNYFRVAYYGTQWPVSLQSKGFIYRGGNWEKFSSFCERMQQRHPHAVLIKGIADPPDDVRFSNGMHIHVTAVKPEPDTSRDVFVNNETPPIVRAYYEHNTTNLFSFTRPVVRRSDSDGTVTVSTPSTSLSDTTKFGDIWHQKTMLRAEDSFPTVLRRSQIAHIDVVQISPIENALTEVDNKTRELETLQVKFSSLSRIVEREGALNTNRLSMALNSAVDAPVNGGIPTYKQTFFTPQFVLSHPDAEPMVLKLKEAIDRQAVIISRCLLLHSRLCPAEMRPFHDTLDRFFRQNFAEEIARLELESASTSNDTGDAITNGQEDATGMTHSVTNGTMERSTSYSTINGIRSEGGGAEAPSLDLASVASDLRSTPVKISPLQQHIAYLAKQSQPIKSSPTAVLETNTSATSNARRVSAGVATDTPLDAQSISTVTGKQPSAIAGQAAVPATNPNLTSVYGAPSVMSGTSYAATNKGTQPSILSAVTKGGRERASRLFGSVRKR